MYAAICAGLSKKKVTTQEGNPCEGLGADFKAEVSSPAKNRSIDEIIRKGG